MRSSILNTRKIITRLTFVILGVVLFSSCDKEQEEDPLVINDGSVTAEKTDVNTYEIISLISNKNLADKYNATFGSVPIEILKTSDSTLTFFVPEIAEGEATLRFELAEIKFDVSKTADVNPDQLITNFTQNFDTQISTLNPLNPEEIDRVNTLIEYKEKVITLFNSLPEEEKRQSTLFYEANKDVFKSFMNNSFANLDAVTTMNKQSECPNNEFRTFYGCTGENLGMAADDLKIASKRFLLMIGIAGASAVLAPFSLGLSAFTANVSLGIAAYIFIAEIGPAAFHLSRSIGPFLESNWILGNDLFNEVTDTFPDQISTSLNVKPMFRSLTPDDGYINYGSSFFIRSMDKLKVYWNKLTIIFGNFPIFNNTEEPTTLETNEVSISNISNPNVQYIGNTGQSVKFKSTTGNDESFEYNIKVSKEGFIEDKTLLAKVVAVNIDSTEFYKAAVIGTWLVKNPESNDPPYDLELYSGGTGKYFTASGDSYNITWEIRKHNNKYYFHEEGFWHFAFNLYRVIGQDLPYENLSYPITKFIHYNDLGDGPFEALLYTKN